MQLQNPPAEVVRTWSLQGSYARGKKHRDPKKLLWSLPRDKLLNKNKQNNPPKKNPTPPTNPQNKHLCLTLAEQNLSVSDYNYFCFLVVIDPLAAWL